MREKYGSGQGRHGARSRRVFDHIATTRRSAQEQEVGQDYKASRSRSSDPLSLPPKVLQPFKIMPSAGDQLFNQVGRVPHTIQNIG